MTPDGRLRALDRRGMTLIELLIVMIVLGILAMIALPNLRNSQAQVYLTTLRSDLRILANQQELYQSQNQVYADELQDMTQLLPSEGVTIFINETSAGLGWAATAIHEGLPDYTCGIYYGIASAANGAPATDAGVVTCAD